MKPTKPMSCYRFGEALLRVKDLDPVYTLAYHANFSPDMLRRWLLAYWCFYDVGTACWVADHRHNDYWARMMTAALSKDYPRGRERRHFRGGNATASVTWLSGVGLLKLFSRFDKAKLTGRSLRADRIMTQVKAWVGFGPWVSFKVADMLERVYGVDVEFDTSNLHFFDSPREGAHILWEKEGKPSYGKGREVCWAVEKILTSLRKMPDPYNRAPPSYNRTLGTQEAETVLCKWKSYLGGHYHVGEDVAACRRALLRFSKVPLAQALLADGAKGGLW
jgi:hypothetical protein